MSAPTTQATPVRILLVDKNKSGLAARKRVLEDNGYGITTSLGAQEALELFRSDHFGLVITDYRMPLMDGVEFIRNIRESKPDVPVILISSVVEVLGLNESNTGADAVIQKSALEVNHLLRSVSRLLARKLRKPPASHNGSPRPKRRPKSS